MQSILWDYLNSLKGKKIAVIGMGVSNAPLVKKMLQAGLTVCVCDKREREDFDGLSELESKGLKVSLGPNYLDGLEGADVIFRTPGVRPDLPQIAKAVEAGAELTSEMEYPASALMDMGFPLSTNKTPYANRLLHFVRVDGDEIAC